MRSRSLLVSLPLLCLVAFVACDDHDHRRDDSDNEIVFGIRQEVGQDGKATVSAEYEYLALAHHGGWVTRVFKDGDGDGVCYFERFDHRIGKPLVESGAASFRGGALPTGGVQLLANQADPAKAAGGWAPGDVLTFEVTGFAMPPVRPITMTAPPTSLNVTSISPSPSPDGAVVVDPTHDVSVAWAPADDPRSTHVLVALVTDEDKGPGGEVRCFASGVSGSVVIPSLSVGQLFSSVTPGSPIKGRLLVASHRQATVRAHGDWTIYVVATALHRDLAFTSAGARASAH